MSTWLGWNLAINFKFEWRKNPTRRAIYIKKVSKANKNEKKINNKTIKIQANFKIITKRQRLYSARRKYYRTILRRTLQARWIIADIIRYKLCSARNFATQYYDIIYRTRSGAFLVFSNCESLIKSEIYKRKFRPPTR